MALTYKMYKNTTVYYFDVLFWRIILRKEHYFAILERHLGTFNNAVVSVRLFSVNQKLSLVVYSHLHTGRCSHSFIVQR